MEGVCVTHTATQPRPRIGNLQPVISTRAERREPRAFSCERLDLSDGWRVPELGPRAPREVEHRRTISIIWLHRVSEAPIR